MMTKAPIFIVGMQRSGTTFLRLLLNRSDELFIPFETDFISALETFSDVDFNNDSQKKAVISAIEVEPFTQKAGLTLNHTESIENATNMTELLDAFYTDNCHQHNKKRWGIKTPGYILSMHKVLNYFPNAKFIVVMRDPRGIFYSQKNISWGLKDPVKLAYQWNQANHNVELIERLFPQQIYVLKYEQLIEQIAPETQKLCQFIDIPFSDKLLDFSNAATDMPESSKQWHQSSVSKPDLDKIIAWQQHLKPIEKKIIQDICEEFLCKWDYSIDLNHIRKLDKLKHKLEYAFHYA